MTPLILYHAGCSDGFAAAWAAWRRFGNDAEYRPVSYGNPPTDFLVGRDIYIIDFSYLPEFVNMLAEEAATLTLLDHHKTALDRFTKAWGPGAKEVAPARGGIARPQMTHWSPTKTARVTVDIDQSGAQLAWDYFHAGKPRPWTIDYVADRDLWRWALPNSREVNAYLRSLPHDFIEWEKAIGEGTLEPPLRIIDGGTAILQMQAREIERAVRRAKWGPWSGFPPNPRAMSAIAHTDQAAHILRGASKSDVLRAIAHIDAAERLTSALPMVAVVNVTENISEVLEVLAREPPYFAIGWYQAEDGRYRYSLRSTKDGPDVAEIAEAFGGGGHRQAAGFELGELVF